MSPRPSSRTPESQRKIALIAGFGSIAVILGFGAAILHFRPNPLETRPVRDKKEVPQEGSTNPDAAGALYDRLRTEIGAGAWQRHRFDPRTRSKHHGQALQLWYDSKVSAAIKNKRPVSPGGVVVLRVVDGLGDPRTTFVARREEGRGEHSWTYAEYDSGGVSISFGRMRSCMACHGEALEDGQTVFRFLDPVGSTDTR